MRSINRTDYLPILILLHTCLAIVGYSNRGSFTVSYHLIWLIAFLTISCIWLYKYYYFSPNNTRDYRIVGFYLFWLLLSIIRGYFVAENYWEDKQLIDGSLFLSFPLFVYVFSIPEILQKTLRLWVKFALPVLLVTLYLCRSGSLHYCLGPALLLSCFYPIVPKKWMIVFLVILAIQMVVDLGARSQVIKAAVTLIIGVAYLCSNILKPLMIKMIHWLCYITPIILLFLGINGIFNPFEAMSENYQGKLIQTYSDGDVASEDFSDDTRTQIYVEVIESAVKNNYIWHGRTPARGNDSWTIVSVWRDIGMIPVSGKYERHANEVCHPNVFTWLGLIGMTLYGLIYLKSSYLSVYKSNNIWMKILGVFIAFRWAFGWIEDMPNFEISTITLWMMIAMGFSERFRQMNDQQYNEWVQKLFAK